MRSTPLRLLVLAVPVVFLTGCGLMGPRSCDSDTEYLMAVERPPLKLPPEIVPSERVQPLTIPAVDPVPVKLDPQPRCLDEPPQFFARKGGTVADSVEDAVRLWAYAWATRNPDTVTEMYSATFQATGEGGRAAFIEQRRQQVESGRAPDAKLEELEINATGGDRRVVTFVQRFGEGAVRKELTLVREGGVWRIVAERTLEVL